MKTLFPRNQTPAQQNAHAIAFIRMRARESRREIPDVPPGLALVLYTILLVIVGGMTAWAVCNF